MKTNIFGIFSEMGIINMLFLKIHFRLSELFQILSFCTVICKTIYSSPFIIEELESMQNKLLTKTL